MSPSKDLPPPDASGTDPDEALKRRFSIGQPSTGPALPNVGTFATPRPGPRPPAPPKKKTGTRPDPEGMRRTSYYISQEAADAMEAAVAQVLDALGGQLPKHVALSALIKAGAAQAHQVARALAEERTAELAERLKALDQAT